MPIPHEISAAAGKPGTSYRLTLDARDPHVIVLAAPRRVATVTVVDGSPVRHATVDNAGEYGAFDDLAVGDSIVVEPDDGARMFMADPQIITPISVVISEAR